MALKNNEIPENFPTWAPTKLIEVIKFLSDSDRFDQATENAEIVFINLALCTHPAMEHAWRLLRKKFIGKYQFEFEYFVSEFSIQVYGAYFKREGYGAGTKKEQKKREKIVKVMSELATLLDSSPFDTEAVSCFSKDEMKGLYSILNSIAAWPTNENVVADLSINDRKSFENNFFVCRKLAYFSISEQIDYGFKPYNVLQMPLLSDILMRYSTHLKSLDLPSVVGNEKSISKKGEDLTDLKYFLRVMSAFFTAKLGSPHYAILSCIGNAFFDDISLDADRVKSFVQNRTKAKKGVAKTQT